MTFVPPNQLCITDDMAHKTRLLEKYASHSLISSLLLHLFDFAGLSASSTFVCTRKSYLPAKLRDEFNLATRLKMPRTKRIDIRVTPEELQAIKAKAAEYPSVTALIIDAIQDFDTRKGRNAIDRMIEFAQAAQKFETAQARIGTNVNQIAHALNLYEYNQVSLVDIKEVADAIDESNKLNKEIIKSLRRIIDLTS